MTQPASLSTAETLKRLILETFNLQDLDPADFDDEALLFGPQGIGLDSLDAVELVILIQKNFGVQIRDMKESRVLFRSVETLARHIDSQRTA